MRAGARRRLNRGRRRFGRPSSGARRAASYPVRNRSGRGVAGPYAVVRLTVDEPALNEGSQPATAPERDSGSRIVPVEGIDRRGSRLQCPIADCESHRSGGLALGSLPFAAELVPMAGRALPELRTRSRHVPFEELRQARPEGVPIGAIIERQSNERVPGLVDDQQVQITKELSDNNVARLEFAGTTSSLFTRRLLRRRRSQEVEPPLPIVDIDEEACLAGGKPEVAQFTRQNHARPCSVELCRSDPR